MAKDKWRISATVLGSKRALLLRMFPPGLERIYCQAITWAYNVPGDYTYPTHNLDVWIIGIHRSDSTEALICRVDGQERRPDGKRFHITLSTSVDVPPAQAGDINESRIEFVPSVQLSGMWLRREPLRPARFDHNNRVRKAA